MATSRHLRQLILEKVTEYCAEAFRPEPFVPGRTPVPVSGRVFSADDVKTLVDSALDFWLTAGRFAQALEKDLATFLGARWAILCNSGSSANLLALSSLTSAELGDRRLSPGDEVVTVAAGFPSTVSPIVQNRLVPVFVDIDLPTYNIDTRALEQAVGPRTRAVMVAHTLGNPADLDAISEICAKHDLLFVEDNCDALGSTYKGRLTGTFGHLATISFYPAHHITTGEGGCVVTSSGQLKRLVCAFRDWGRDCWCDPGKENTCGKRFGWQLGDLPYGYDHKYTYSHIGYNLKMTDLQASIGVSQLKALPGFIAIRKRNWTLLREGLQPFEDVLVLPEPTPGADPSWFGFLITVRHGAPFSRADLVSHLEGNRIATRFLFAGDLTRQPAYQGVAHRISGALTNTETVMNRTFWIGVYPAITEEMVQYVVGTFRKFLSR